MGMYRGKVKVGLVFRAKINESANDVQCLRVITNNTPQFYKTDFSLDSQNPVFSGIVSEISCQNDRHSCCVLLFPVSLVHGECDFAKGHISNAFPR